MNEPYKDIVIPTELAHRLQQIFQMDAVPRTLGDLTLSGCTLGPFTDGSVAKLISATPTRHQVFIGGENLYTHCAMDAFMLPVLRVEPAEFYSVDPTTNKQVRVRVTPEMNLNVIAL